MQKNQTYRKALDGLRGFAILAVVANHFDHNILPSGYLGVDIFYVISGFVITQSLIRHEPDAFSSFLFGFFSRRIKRLFPALVAYVLPICLLVSMIDPSAEPTILTGIFSLGGLSNLLLLYKSTDYFGPSSELNTFTHTWSLGVEEQFYFLYPLLFWFLKPNLGTSKPSRYRRLSICLLAIFLISLASFIVLYEINQPAAYFLMPTRVWELASGAMLFFFLSRKEAPTRWNPLPIEAVIPISLVAALLIPSEYPVTATLACITLTLALIIALEKERVTRRLFETNFLVHLGKISYSIYLWHWGVISLSRWTIGIHWWSIPFQILLTYTLARLSYKFAEEPFRRSRAAPSRTLMVGALSVLISIGICFVIYVKHESLFIGNLSQVDEGVTTNSFTPKSDIHANDCLYSIKPASDPDLLNYFSKKCSTTHNKLFKVIITGDSHALDLLPIIDDLSESLGQGVLFTAQPGCKYPAFGKNKNWCDLPSEITERRIRDNSDELILVIRQNLSPRSMTKEYDDHLIALKKLLNRMTELNVKVVVIAPAPKSSMAVNGGICYEQPFRPHWAISDLCSSKSEPRMEQEIRRNDYVAALRNLQLDYPILSIFDPFDILCARVGDYCTLTDAKDFFYRDQSHLTVAGSKTLTQSLASHLKSLLNK